MCPATQDSQDPSPFSNGMSTAIAPPSIVVISSNSTAESIVAGLKGESLSADLAAGSQDYVDATDLTREQWIKVLTSSSVLRAWKGQTEGGGLHINRAPCAALALKPKESEENAPGEGMPEFEVADETYIETRETKSSLEREMTLKAFTETSIRAALSGGAQDIGFGLGGAVSWQNDQTASGIERESTTAVHGFYNFPRAILHLHPDNFKLSAQCERFFAKNGARCFFTDEVDAVLREFYDRFGAVLPARVTLGGRLCTTQEVTSGDQTTINDIQKSIRTQLDATIKGGGAGLDTGMARNRGSDQKDRQVEQNEASRMSVETQGGNGLLASSISDWTASVSSYRFWRAIKQERPQNLLELLADVTTGTVICDQINALVSHAKLQYKHNLDLLEVSVTGASPLVIDTDRVRSSMQVRFTIKTRISQPRIVHQMALHATLDDTVVAQQDHSEDFGRERVREDLSSNFEFRMVRITTDTTPRLPQACNVAIRIWLEPFMAWGKEAQRYVVQRGTGNPTTPMVVLVWPDIEVNPSMRWSLPVYRRSLLPIPLESVVSGQTAPLITEQYPQATTAVAEKKSRNPLSRR